MAERLKIVVDHDAGTNSDDLLAFLLLLHAPDADIAMTVSGNNHPVERARYAHRFFTLAGRADIPCYAGEANGSIAFHGWSEIDGMDFNPPHDYGAALKSLCAQTDRVIYLAIQGLSNLDRFLALYPAMATKLSVYHMGLTLTGADTGFVTGGTNVAADPGAARRIYDHPGLDLKIVGSHTTIHDALRIAPDTRLHQILQASDQPAVRMVYRSLLDFHDRRGIWPALHDPLTASAALQKDFVAFQVAGIDFADDGTYTIGHQTRLSVSHAANYAAFMRFFADML